MHSRFPSPEAMPQRENVFRAPGVFDQLGATNSELDGLGAAIAQLEKLVRRVAFLAPPPLPTAVDSNFVKSAEPPSLIDMLQEQNSRVTSLRLHLNRVVEHLETSL